MLAAATGTYLIPASKLSMGSRLGSNLPVLLVAKPGLNGVESTNRYKVNSRMLYR